MKKLLLSIFMCAFFLVGFTVDATAQRSSSSSDGGGMALKANPIALAFNIYNAVFEKSMGKTSFLVGASYASKILGIDVSSFGADVGYRYYISGGDMEGFYFNPKLGFSKGSSGGSSGASYGTYGLAAELGYQVRTDGGFIFDIGIGPSWNKFFGDYDGIGFDTSGSSYTSPSGTLAFGYAF